MDFPRQEPGAIYGQLQPIVEAEQDGYLWGEHYRITPALLPWFYGDGEALFALTTINSRPWFYVIRGDSSWRVETDRTNRTGPDFRDLCDDIIEDLREVFGNGDLCEICDADDRDHDECECQPWPAVDATDGCSWSRCDDWFAPAPMQGEAS